MTNRDWLFSLPNDKFYDEWYAANQNVGMRDINTRLRIIDWLDEEHIIEQPKLAIEYYQEWVKQYLKQNEEESNHEQSS